MGEESYTCPYCGMTVYVPYWKSIGGIEEEPIIDTIGCPHCSYPYELVIVS